MRVRVLRVVVTLVAAFGLVFVAQPVTSPVHGQVMGSFNPKPPPPPPGPGG